MKYIKTKAKLLIIIMLAAVCFIFIGCDADMYKTKAIAKTEESSTEPTTETETETVEPVIRTAKIAVTGDLMVHSYQYEEAYNKETGNYDFSHNFQDVKKYFDKADYVMGNLETVLGGNEIGISDFPNFNTPDSFLDAVKEAGFDYLTTANNHCVDRGTDSLLRTIEKLDEYNIDHTGTYASKEARDSIFLKGINGITFAILSYTYGTNGMPYDNDYNVNIINEELIRKDIAKAKTYDPDFIIVLPHMGNEYEEYVNDTFKMWADVMFDAGADIILASHPHVLQPMEMRTLTKEDGSQRKGFIIYSLGNFISSQTTPPRNAGLILNLSFKKIGDENAEITEVSYIPVWTQFRNPEGRNHFVVRSVYEMLTLPENELYSVVRSQDVDRLKNIHHETTGIYSETEIPLDKIQDEYIFYTADNQ